jgi:UPF0716 protein FxsA
MSDPRSTGRPADQTADQTAATRSGPRLRSGFRPGRLIPVGLLLTPVLELAAAIWVGGIIGAGYTLLLLAAGCLAGVLVLRREGAASVRRLTARPGTADAAARRPPAHAVVAVLAGLLLLFPGFMTDLVGLVLLIPAVQRAVSRRAGEALMQRMPNRSIRIVQGQVISEGPTRAEAVDVRVIRVGPEPSEPPATPPMLPAPDGDQRRPG